MCQVQVTVYPNKRHNFAKCYNNLHITHRCQNEDVKQSLKCCVRFPANGFLFTCFNLFVVKFCNEVRTLTTP